MSVDVLGQILLRTGEGEALPLPRDQQRRLVAILVLHAGTAVSADRLVEAVWNDDDRPQDGVRALRTRVSRLRPLLATAGLELFTEGSGYRLEPTTTDASRFETLAEKGRVALEAREFDAALEAFDAGLRLWRGRAYDDVADLEWANPESVRLGELHTACVEHRFEALLSKGRHTAVIAPIREAIAGAPYRDRLRGQLMLALYRSGRQAEALRAYESYRRELGDETGLEPGPELSALADQLHSQDPALMVAERGDSLRGYTLDEVIGEGAFATVWRGSQDLLEREVAIKQVRAELANRVEFVRRFEVEAQLIAAVEHPHIVPLYDYWREADAAYLVMRMLPGGSLEQRIASGPLDEDELARFITQIGSALHAAHRAGVIHRDVKPANVMLDADGNFYLTDFGIAFDAEQIGPAEELSTGSPAYASPEQMRGLNLGPKSDLYSLGITLYEAATGELPFMPAAPSGDLERVLFEEPVPSPSSVRPDLPHWVDEMVLGATAKNGDHRFESAEGMLEALDKHGGIDAIVSSSGTPVLLNPLRNPYKALQAFSEADTQDFFGRDLLVDRLLDVLRRPGLSGRILAVVGPSGSGKSSVVSAGLIPKLRSGAIESSDDWFITSMAPGAHPFSELETALARIAVAPPGQLVELMAGDVRGITRAVSQVLPSDDSELLLVIDQFEELFTQTIEEGVRAQFLDALVSTLREGRARVRIILTIRADFWDRPLAHPEMAELLAESVVNVGPHAPAELEQAIVAPVRQQGMVFESGLVARLIADVAKEPGALPLLQYTLTELFAAHMSGLIQTSTYDRIGGLGGALVTRAELIYGQLDADGKTAARRLFGQLVTSGDSTEHTSRRVLLKQIPATDPARRAVEEFGAARLLTFDRDPDSRNPTVEIAHEALLRAWPRLQQWIDEDRDNLRTQRHLADTAAHWQAGNRDSAELYRGARLEGAVELVESNDVDLAGFEREFLAASVAATEEERLATRRRTRILQGLLGATAVLLVIAMVAGLVALNQRGDAKNAQLLAEENALTAAENAEAARGAEAIANANAEEADAARLAAEVSRMSSEASILARTNPQAALVLAVEAHRLLPSIETLGGLQNTMLQTGPVQRFLGNPERTYLAVEWTNNDLVVALHEDGLEATDLATGVQVVDVAFSPTTDIAWRQPGAAPIVVFDASPDGQWAAAGTSDNTVVVVNLVSGEETRISENRSATSIAFRPDSAEFATGYDDGEIVVRRSGNSETLWSVDAHPEPFEFWIDELADTVPNLGSGQLADPANRDLVDRGVAAMIYSVDGDALVSSEYPVIRSWDAEDGSLLREAVPLLSFRGFELPAPSIVDELLAYDEAIGELSFAGRHWVATVSLLDGAVIEHGELPDDRNDTNVVHVGSYRVGSNDWLIAMSDGRIRRMVDGEPTLTLTLPFSRPGRIAPSPDGARIAAPGAGGVAVVDLRSPSLLAEALPSEQLPIGAGFTTDGEWASLSWFGSTLEPRLYVHDGSSWHEESWPRSVLELVEASSEPTLFSETFGLSDLPPNLVIDTDQNGRRWITSEPVLGTLLWFDDTLAAPTGGSIPAVATAWGVSKDAKYYATQAAVGFNGGFDQAVEVFDAKTGVLVVSLQDFAADLASDQRIPRSMSFEPSGDRFIATLQNGRVGMWDTASWAGGEITEEIGHTVVASFSPDGRWLATADRDGAVTIRHADSFEIHAVLSEPRIPEPLGGFLSWSLDGNYLVSGFEATGRLFDVETGRQIGSPFPGTTGSIPTSTNGEVPTLGTLVDGYASVWNLDTSVWASIACEAAGRNLTQAEWAQFGPTEEPYNPTCAQYPAGS